VDAQSVINWAVVGQLSCLKSAATARKVIAMVRRTFRNLDIADFRLIYKTYIRPQMELCIQAWSPHFVKDIDTPYGPRGHEKKLAKDRSRLDSRKFFFSQRVVNEWNSLPAKVVNSESVNSFKNAYDRYYWTTEADQLPVHQPTSSQVQLQVSIIY